MLPILFLIATTRASVPDLVSSMEFGIGGKDAMHKFYYVGFAVNIALNTFSMGAPVDGIENLLRPLVACSEVLF